MSYTTEIQLQALIFQRLWNKAPQFRRRLWSTPNEGQRHNGNKFKASGLIPGMPDLNFLTSSGEVIFFELKTTTGRLSKNQLKQKYIINQTKAPFYIVRTPDGFFYALIYELMKRNELNTDQALELFKTVQGNEGIIFFNITEEQFLYEVKVFQYLFKLEPGEEKVIAELSSEKTRGQFINAIKKFIHLEYDFGNGFQITFNEKFTKFVKLCL